MSDMIIEIILALSYLTGVMFIASMVTLKRVFDYVIEFYEEI